MSIVSFGWFGRISARRTRNVIQDQRDQRPPMKIEIERLPDYCWRDLGFALPARDEE